MIHASRSTAGAGALDYYPLRRVGRRRPAHYLVAARLLSKSTHRTVGPPAIRLRRQRKNLRGTDPATSRRRPPPGDDGRPADADSPTDRGAVVSLARADLVVDAPFGPASRSSSVAPGACAPAPSCPPPPPPSRSSSSSCSCRGDVRGGGASPPPPRDPSPSPRRVGSPPRPRRPRRSLPPDVPRPRRPPRRARCGTWSGTAS